MSHPPQRRGVVVLFFTTQDVPNPSGFYPPKKVNYRKIVSVDFGKFLHHTCVYGPFVTHDGSGSDPSITKLHLPPEPCQKTQEVNHSPLYLCLKTDDVQVDDSSKHSRLYPVKGSPLSMCYPPSGPLQNSLPLGPNSGVVFETTQTLNEFRPDRRRIHLNKKLGLALRKGDFTGSVGSFAGTPTNPPAIPETRKTFSRPGWTESSQ